MEFKKWLKNNIATEDMFYETNMISIHAFGEWAWEELLKDWKNITHSKVFCETITEHLQTCYAPYALWSEVWNGLEGELKESQYWKFAIACLGEKEVKKRFKRFWKNG